MRSRVLEIVSALIGVAVVIWLYGDQSWWSDEKASDSTAPVMQTVDVATEPAVPLQPSQASPPAAASKPPEPLTTPPSAATETMDVGVIAASQAEWASAKQAVAAVVTELEALDLRFDEMEEEFAAAESENHDPEQLEEEILIQLDEIVTQYAELESQLLEAQRAEQKAAALFESLSNH